MVFLISPVLWAGFDRAACLSWWLPHWSSFQQEHLTAPSGISVWKAAICEGFLFFFFLKWFYQFWPNKPGRQKGVSVAIAAGADPYAWLECDFLGKMCWTMLGETEPPQHNIFPGSVIFEETDRWLWLGVKGRSKLVPPWCMMMKPIDI